MVYLIGIALALGTVATFRQFPRRELQLYATGLVVAAWIYVAFAALGGAGGRWIGIELGGVVFYSLFAFWGVRRGWAVGLALGWAIHVAWDVLLHGPETPFVPWWYPPICLAYDFVMAAYIAWRFRDGASP